MRTPAEARLNTEYPEQPKTGALIEIVPPGTVVPPGGYFSLSEALAWIGSRNEALCNAVRWFQRRPERQDAAGHASLYRSEEHTSELQSLIRNSYYIFCLK